VPAGYQLPPVLPYKEGRPIPPGYRLEERPRRGLLITGYILSGVGYGIGLLGAYSSGFANKSGWMVVPWAGPWLTMGLRDYHDCDSVDDEETDDPLDCSVDALVVFALFMDGMLQLGGGIPLLIGYTVKKKELVRQDASLHLLPTRVGDGYGLTALGSF
jgi:hypothetical protein